MTIPRLKVVEGFEQRARNALHHWHPVLRSNELGKKPVAVKVLGHDIVVWRAAEAGGVAAVEDRCPHRRMKLSTGWVEGNDIVCPYHGLRIGCDGEAKSENSPGYKACATAYEAVETTGVIWLRAAGADSRMPDLSSPGFHNLTTVRRRFHAPLELVLDNFCEIEHVATTHKWFAYDRTALPNVRQEMRLTSDCIEMVARGPQRRLPFPVPLVFGVHSGDIFTIKWQMYFSPVHAIYEHSWVNPKTGEERKRKGRGIAFFTPIDENTTDVVFFITVSSGTSRWIRPLLAKTSRPLIDTELAQDAKIVETLADHETGIEGMRLGRFDQALGPLRKRLRSVYYAQPAAVPIAVAE